MAPQGNFRHAETHSPVSREELMMVLAGLQQLQIRTLFSKFSTAVSLRRVALEVASKMGRGPPASNVELCMCPANYLGDSCQVRGGQAPGGSPPSFPPPGWHPPSSPTFPLRLSQRLLICLLPPRAPASPPSVHCPSPRWAESDL